jgi:hypothetical protein
MVYRAMIFDDSLLTADTRLFSHHIVNRRSKLDQPLLYLNRSYAGPQRSRIPPTAVAYSTVKVRLVEVVVLAFDASVPVTVKV